jgi:hypothetical protein
MFNISKDKRDILWKSDVKNIENRNILKLIKELEDSSSIECEFVL